MDALGVDLLDLHVAFAAGLVIWAWLMGTFVVAPFNVVNAVAVVAGRATMRPILSSARPWMLSRYCAPTLGNRKCIPRSSRGCCGSWRRSGEVQLEHRRIGFFTGIMECEPWQLAQVAALAAPR